MHSDAPFTVALLQSAVSPDPRANLAHTIELIRQAASRGAQIICTQELFLTPYFCQSENPAHFDLAESIPGPTTQTLSALARELNVVLIASLFERRAPGLYHNTAAILDADGTLVGTYRKMHIPDDPLYYEKYYFTPGDAGPDGGFKTFTTRFAKLGVLICWDQWFPEAARLTALQDCSILFYPTAIGWHPAEKHSHGHAQASAWQTVQRAHAITNGIFVAAVNRVGLEQLPASGADAPVGSSPSAGSPNDGLEFFGGSFVTDPFGRVIAKAPPRKEEILLATIDPQLQEETRRNWPFLRDRRIDAYAGITQRFGK